MRFCSHPSYEARHSQKRRRYPDLRQMLRQWKRAEASRSDAAHCGPDERSDIRERSRSSSAAPGFRFAHPGYKIKGSRTPTDAVRNRLPCGKRAPCRARSPVGVPRRLCPRDSRIPKVQPGPGFAEQAPVDGGGIPPAFAPVPASTSHAGHNAGRHDVRAAREQMGTNPLPAGTAPAPASRSHRLTSLHEEREAGFYSLSPILSSIVATHVTMH